MKIVLLLLLLLIQVASAEPPVQPTYAKAKILAVETFAENQMREVSQRVTFRVTSGKFKDRVESVDHMTSSMMGGEMRLKKGERVILYVDENPSEAESPTGEPLFNIADYVRDGPLFWLAFFYVLLLLVIGGVKGFRSIISLIVTIGMIFLVLFPLTLWGVNPLLTSVLLAGVVSLISFRLIGGRTVKSLSAAIGTLFGVAIAGILAFFVGKMIHLTGLSSEEARILLYSMDLKINYQGLLFGSILIGALGAVMDIGMSIASAVDEICKVHPEANFNNLFKAGMNVGRDVMGTMSNTLILAYTGSALPLLLLLVANNVSFSKIINTEMIAVEVVRALAGSIGLVLCIPITAVVSAFLNSKIKK